MALTQIKASNITDGTVVAAEIASDAVTTVKILNLNVTTAKIAADSIDATKIADNAINSEHYTDGSIDTAHIANDQITGAKIVDNAINSEHYTDASIDLAHMSVNSIDSDQYVDGSVDDAHLATGISASKLTGSLPALTLAGALTGADQTVSAINFKDYGHITNALGSAGGTRTINLTLGNSITATVATSTNTFVFSNPTASDELSMFILFLTNGGSQTVAWPGTVDWAGGTAPTLTTSGLDILTFFTLDGGTIWHGVVNSADSK